MAARRPPERRRPQSRGRRHGAEIDRLRARVNEINAGYRNRGSYTPAEEAEIRRISESIRRLKQGQ